jgi:glycosyltransferase involved in cell wall biosynthesis
MAAVSLLSLGVVVAIKVKVLIALNSAWNLFNFRSGLIKAMLDAGYEVVAVAPTDEYVDRLVALGCKFVHLPMENNSINPLKDIQLCFRYWRVLRKERPDIFLGYTVKPNIYGSLAAHVLRIPVINNIAGLGSVFIRDNWITSLVRSLYRLGLSRSSKVFFQNQDDLNAFVSWGIVRLSVVERLPGSGVDLKKFYPKPSLEETSRVIFLMIARMLWDKGVYEYVQAAKAVKAHYPHTEFALLGFLDVKNPSAVSREQMDEWVAQGFVSYWGVSDDVRVEIAQANVIVLPSYREGTPRTLLEASAMGKPVISTDAVGCKDVVEDSVTGFLCKARDSNDLAKKILLMMNLSHTERIQMGFQGRFKMEREFDEKIVIDRYLNVINSLISPATQEKRVFES